MPATISTTKAKPRPIKPRRQPKVDAKAPVAAAVAKEGVKAAPKRAVKTANAKALAKVAAVSAERHATTVSGERHQNEGHGRRLTVAFEALEVFPALAESRDRLLLVVSKDHVATADIVTAVESDVALTIALLRLANLVQGARGRVDTVA